MTTLTVLGIAALPFAIVTVGVAATLGGVFLGGCFWAHVLSASDDWDNADRIEDARREIHERLMHDWVGVDHFSGSRIKVYLARDPRSYLEEIFFEVYRDRRTE